MLCRELSRLDAANHHRPEQLHLLVPQRDQHWTADRVEVGQFRRCDAGFLSAGRVKGDPRSHQGIKLS